MCDGRRDMAGECCLDDRFDVMGANDGRREDAGDWAVGERSPEDAVEGWESSESTYDRNESSDELGGLVLITDWGEAGRDGQDVVDSAGEEAVLMVKVRA